MELQCMGSKRCAWGEWSHLRGDRVMWAGNTIAGAGVLWAGYTCVRGQWFVGLGGVHVQGEVWGFSAGGGCTCTMLCGVRDVCI